MKPKMSVLVASLWFVISLALIFLRWSASATVGASDSVETGIIVGLVKNGATGDYLGNARVTIKDINLMALTDEMGEYRLAGVRSGAVVLNVFYTDLEPLDLPVTVRAGDTVLQNAKLTSITRYGRG